MIDLISVIVPIYNVDKYLRKCIDSILTQTYNLLEIILVDDGSTDLCPDICDEYAKKDSRIIVIHKKNGGLADARNAGLDKATGRYISFIDSDDYIETEMYSVMLEKAKANHADIVSCSIKHVDEKGEIINIWPIIEKDVLFSEKEFITNFYPYIKTIICPSVCNKLYNSFIFDSIRFPVGKIYEDAFIQLETYDKCENILSIKDIFYNYFKRSSSIMNLQHYNLSIDAIEFRKINYSYFKNTSNESQIQYSLNEYINTYFQIYFLYIYNYKINNMKKCFSVPRKQFKMLRKEILSNPNICHMKKIMIIIHNVFPCIAQYIANKYFPECIQK